MGGWVRARRAATVFHTHSPPSRPTPFIHQGERIKRVYEVTGVTKIDVTDQGVVRIAGPTNGAVLQAREMLELMQVGGWVGRSVGRLAHAGGWWVGGWVEEGGKRGHAGRQALCTSATPVVPIVVCRTMD